MTIFDEILLLLEAASRNLRDAEALSRLPAARPPSFTMVFPSTWGEPQKDTDKETSSCQKTNS